MTNTGLKLSPPYPSRRAAEALSDRVITYLKTSRQRVGDKLVTDADLAAQTNLSHSTVRRAMRRLQQEGWIERRAGHGSFVGPRAALGNLDVGIGKGDATQRLAPTRSSAGGQETIRLGIVAHFGRNDWYVAGVLEALDRLAGEKGLAVELFNAWNMANAGDTGRRFARSRPDVIAMITPRLPQAMIAAEAVRLVIPVVATGTALAEMGIPVICEDSVDGASQAVAHSVQRGHRRIGYLGMAVAERFVFARRAGWQRGLTEAGLEPDEGLVCWLVPDADASANTALLSSYLGKQKPTAVVVASSAAMVRLGDYATTSGLRIPEQLSVVTFDQSFDVYRAHFGSTFTPTVVGIPLADIARTIAGYALIAGGSGDIPAKTELTCSWIEGASVQSI